MLASKKSFVRYISHEIRTPLSIVYMGLQFLKSNQETNFVSSYDDSNDHNLAAESDEDLKQCINDMYNACDSAIGILNDLLLFDKLEDGKLLLDKSKIDIGVLLRSALSPFNAQVGGIMSLLYIYLYIYSLISPHLPRASKHNNRPRRNKWSLCTTIVITCRPTWMACSLSWMSTRSPK
jgi:signal transduction histidine kinase